MLKSTVKQYEESTGKDCGRLFFLTVRNMEEEARFYIRIFKEMDFKIGVAFAKDASSLKHGKIQITIWR